MVHVSMVHTRGAIYIPLHVVITDQTLSFFTQNTAYSDSDSDSDSDSTYQCNMLQQRTLWFPGQSFLTGFLTANT